MAQLQGNYTNEELAELRKQLTNRGEGQDVANSPYLNGPTEGTIAADQQANFDPAERDRYRSLGEAAANRQAVQVNFANAQGDRQMGLSDRAGQQNALALQQQAAMGNAPSRAAIMGNQAGGQSLDAALGASAGARPGGMAAAQMAAQRAQGGMQLGAEQQFAGMRSQEMSQARGAYAGGAMGVRAGDYTSMGLSQQQAEAQAQAEIAQRHLNQAGQMGYEQMGINREQQQSDEQLRRMQIEAQKRGTDAAMAQGAMDRDRNDALAVTGGMGSVIGLGASRSNPDRGTSDERAKQNTHMLSDDRTKLAATWDEGHNDALAQVQRMRAMSPKELKALSAKGNRIATEMLAAKADAHDEGRMADKVDAVKRQHASMGSARESNVGLAERSAESRRLREAGLPMQTRPDAAQPAPIRPAGAQLSQTGDPQTGGFRADPAPAPAPRLVDPSSKRELATASASGKATPGAVIEGNIRHYGRPEVQNPDGSISTVRSMSFSDGPGREVLIPTAYDGAVHSDDESIANYRKTGRHMGIFKTPEAATAEAIRVHNDYEAGRYRDDGSHTVEETRPPQRSPMSFVREGAAPQSPSPAQPGYLARAAAALHGVPDMMADQVGRLYGGVEDATSDKRSKQSVRGPDEMTDALADGLKPYSYEYKPGFAESEGQHRGEKNVGPMAQDMASNPITGQAVSQRDDGLLQIDMKKATKLSLAAAGHNAQKIRELEARMKGGR